LRIVYFGTPAFAVPPLVRLLASRHTICGVVTQPDRARGRGQRVSDSPVKALAVQSGIPVVQPDTLRTTTTHATLTVWAPDLGVVAAYGKLIPEDLLRVPRFGMINVHASLLPTYRGAAPIHRAVIDGVPQTGVTIMRVDRMLDAGGMFARAARSVGPDETTDVVERDLAELGATLLMDVVEQIATGTAREEAQDDTLSTYAPRITKEEGLVDWTLPAASVHNRVRGLYPWPHAYTYLDGDRIMLLKSSVDDHSTTAPPGSVVGVSRDGVQVAAGGGSILSIRELQAEGKRPMSARDYLAGHPVAVGACLGPPDSLRHGDGGPPKHAAKAEDRPDER
jgi:methionyl-tRNA formyltransferase